MIGVRPTRKDGIGPTAQDSALKN